LLTAAVLLSVVARSHSKVTTLRLESPQRALVARLAGVEPRGVAVRFLGLGATAQ
jgi:hypothetical protein